MNRWKKFARILPGHVFEWDLEAGKQLRLTNRWRREAIVFFTNRPASIVLKIGTSFTDVSLPEIGVQLQDVTIKSGKEFRFKSEGRLAIRAARGRVELWTR